MNTNKNCRLTNTEIIAPFLCLSIGPKRKPAQIHLSVPIMHNAQSTTADTKHAVCRRNSRRSHQHAADFPKEAAVFPCCLRVSRPTYGPVCKVSSTQLMHTHITESYKHPSFHLVLINITAHYIPQRRRGKRGITKMKGRKKERNIYPT